MGSQQEPVLYKEWSGGLNDAKNLLSLRRNELADIRNMYVARDGHIKKRGGQAKVYATSFFSSNVAHGLYQIRIGTTRYLISTAGTAIYYDNNNVITGTATLTAGANNPVSMAAFKDLLIGWQHDTTVGLNAPFAWNGSGNAAALTTSPPSKAVAGAPFANRFVFGNVTFGGTAYPESVVWSQNGTATTWPTNQIAGIYPGTGKYITALVPFSLGPSVDNSILLIFKDSGLFFGRHQLLGEGALASALVFDGFISDKVGCPAPNGAIEVEGIVYWPSYRGFYAMGADLRPRYIGWPIETFWATIPRNRIPYIKVAYHEKLGQIWWFVSAGASATTNNRVVVWDTIFKRFVGIYDSINANVAANIIDSNLNRLIYTSDYSNYLIYEQDNGNIDIATNFVSWFKTGYLDLDRPKLVKSLRRILVELATESNKSFATYSTLFNYDATQSNAVQIATSGAILDQFTLDQDVLGGSDYSQAWFRVGGQARYVQLEIRPTAANTPFDVYGLGFFVVPTRSAPGAKR